MNLTYAFPLVFPVLWSYAPKFPSSKKSLPLNSLIINTYFLLTHSFNNICLYVPSMPTKTNSNKKKGIILI